jgi:hypothetical protein
LTSVLGPTYRAGADLTGEVRIVRDRRLTRMRRLDPRTDCTQVYRLHYLYEFPWDTVQSLSFALFRTYAVPSIGRLLFDTGEFTERVQRRYDDTNLILETIVDAGFAAADGRAAVRRMNQMHGAYDISNDDFRYVLSTFVVMPVRWLARFGWRPLTELELTAIVEHYRALGRHMAIKDIPADYAGFAALLDSYEAAHFAFDPKSRAVADATLDLLATFAPYRLLPRRIVRRLSYALMDEPLLTALRYPRPGRLERRLVEAGLQARARFVRLLPPRRRPSRAQDRSRLRSYPHGFRIDQLGTFPRGCPVVHRPDAAADGAPGRTGLSRS